ncbi:MAG: hypothetical protein QNJ40_07990 [Xanthomonadales bacterium]|nr:hypothetical protein [Xanthomonadales bacterium]
MKKFAILLTLFIVAVAFAAPVAAGNAERPFKGSFSGVVLGFDPVIGDRCPNTPPGKFPVFVASFEGWGTATHLGNSYIFGEHCSYGTVDAGGPDGTYGQGILILIAANGDVLEGTYDDGMGLSGPPVIGFIDRFTFVDGGTGRFTFASGGGLESGFVDVTDFSFSIKMKGVINYSRR